MIKLPIKCSCLATVLLLTLGHNANATVFLLPATHDHSLIGIADKQIYVKATANETLLDIARKHDLGQNQIVKANKNVDRWMPSKPTEKTILDKEGNQFLRLGDGKSIHIPNSYLLPNTERKGIVLNLPEYRLYYYRDGQVITHPISIGRVDWNTPLGKTSILAKVRNPTWTPPASIRREHAAQGDILPAVFPAGPDNPLGLYAMRLARAGYLIHSTNKPLGVGMRVSHGCIRMYPEDIERIFPFVAVGTSVEIVNEPIKVGWSRDGLYIEIHPDLDNNAWSYQQRLDFALNLIEQAKGNELITISGSVLKKAIVESNGIPVMLYKGAKMFATTPTTFIQPQTQPIIPATPPAQKQPNSTTPTALSNQTEPTLTIPPPPRLNDKPIDYSNTIKPSRVLKPTNITPSTQYNVDYNNAAFDTRTIIPPNHVNSLPRATQSVPVIEKSYPSQQVPENTRYHPINPKTASPQPSNVSTLPPNISPRSTDQAAPVVEQSYIALPSVGNPTLPTHQLPPPRLEPEYSILKSTVPPN
jgi:L,D-transpeptidase ErfK/SrfK